MKTLNLHAKITIEELLSNEELTSAVYHENRELEYEVVSRRSEYNSKVLYFFARYNTKYSDVGCYIRITFVYDFESNSIRGVEHNLNYGCEYLNRRVALELATRAVKDGLETVYACENSTIEATLPYFYTDCDVYLYQMWPNNSTIRDAAHRLNLK